MSTPSKATPSFEELLGGRWGVVEAVAPSLGFAIGILFSLPVAIGAAVAIATVLLVVAALQKRPISRPLGGLAAAGIGAALVAFSGRGETYFLPSLLRTGGSLLLCLGSIALHRPVIGYTAAFIDSSWKGWRESPALVRAARNATLLWSAIFALRLGVKLPYYLAGQTRELGFLELGLGWPLFVVGLVGTWYLLKWGKVTASREATPGQ